MRSLRIFFLICFLLLEGCKTRGSYDIPLKNLDNITLDAFSTIPSASSVVFGRINLSPSFLTFLAPIIGGEPGTRIVVFTDVRSGTQYVYEPDESGNFAVLLPSGIYSMSLVGMGPLARVLFVFQVPLGGKLVYIGHLSADHTTILAGAPIGPIIIIGGAQFIRWQIEDKSEDAQNWLREKFPTFNWPIKKSLIIGPQRVKE
ncbi:MAG: hypothetical protein AABZ57_03860 [Candidatus Margulisiibacteriota bacterium]